MLREPIGLLCFFISCITGDSASDHSLQGIADVFNMRITKRPGPMFYALDEDDEDWTPHIDPSRTQINCYGRQSTFYAVGCNDRYTKCHKNTATVYECPKGDYFFVEIGKCASRQAVKQSDPCKNPWIYKEIVHKSPVPFSCAGKKNGPYPKHGTPCDRVYYQCENEVAKKQECNEFSKFDMDIKDCNNRDDLNMCLHQLMYSCVKKTTGATTRTPDQMPSRVCQKKQWTRPYNYRPEDFPNDIEYLGNAANETVPDCKRIGDGFFEEATCSKNFYLCAYGAVMKYGCIQDLFFDSEKILCDHREFIPRCGGTRPLNAMKVDTPLKNNNCESKADGYYPIVNCEGEFYDCTRGTARQMICQEGLVFDKKKERCCSLETCSTYTDICVGKKDGYYSAQCAENYFTCNKEVPQRFSCPAGQRFLLSMHRCDSVDNVTECTGFSPFPVVIRSSFFSSVSAHAIYIVLIVAATLLVTVAIVRLRSCCRRKATSLVPKGIVF